MLSVMAGWAVPACPLAPQYLGLRECTYQRVWGSWDILWAHGTGSPGSRGRVRGFMAWGLRDRVPELTAWAH